MSFLRESKEETRGRGKNKKENTDIIRITLIPHSNPGSILLFFVVMLPRHVKVYDESIILAANSCIKEWDRK